MDRRRRRGRLALPQPPVAHDRRTGADDRRAGRRAALPGVVHDSSSSGQTLYVEPLESVDQQNAVVEVELAERREVQRLLADLTGHVRAAAGALAATEQAIVALDARQAIARFAELMDAVRPTFTDGELSLRGARHPLMIPGVMAAGYQGELDAPAGANEPLGGVEGEEHQKIYERTDDGTTKGRGTVEVAREITVMPGQAIAFMPDDIHSIHVLGDRSIMHLHMYGKALEEMTGRVAYDTKSGTYATFPAHRDIMDDPGEG